MYAGFQAKTEKNVVRTSTELELLGSTVAMVFEAPREQCSGVPEMPTGSPDDTPSTSLHSQTLNPKGLARPFNLTSPQDVPTVARNGYLRCSSRKWCWDLSAPGCRVASR